MNNKYKEACKVLGPEYGKYRVVRNFLYDLADAYSASYPDWRPEEQQALNELFPDFYLSQFIAKEMSKDLGYDLLKNPDRFLEQSNATPEYFALFIGVIVMLGKLSELTFILKCLPEEWHNDWVVSFAVIHNRDEYKFIKGTLSDEVKLAILQNRGELIQFMDNPTPKMIGTAVKESSRNIEYLDPEYHTDKLYEIALKGNCSDVNSLIRMDAKKFAYDYFLQHSESETEIEECFLIYLRKFPDAKELYPEVVRRSPKCLLYIQDKTEELVKIAVVNDPRNMHKYVTGIPSDKLADIIYPIIVRNPFLTNYIRRLPDLPEKSIYIHCLSNHMSNPFPISVLLGLSLIINL